MIVCHDNNAKSKLSPIRVTQVFLGSGFNLDEKLLILWEFYPSNKRPMIVDIEKEFGHVMTLKVGEEDPMIIVDLGINMAKLNKAQIQLLVKENNAYKLMNNKIVK